MAIRDKFVAGTVRPMTRNNVHGQAKLAFESKALGFRFKMAE